jgi:hypothetical protein
MKLYARYDPHIRDCLTQSFLLYVTDRKAKNKSSLIKEARIPNPLNIHADQDRVVIGLVQGPEHLKKVTEFVDAARILNIEVPKHIANREECDHILFLSTKDEALELCRKFDDLNDGTLSFMHLRVNAPINWTNMGNDFLCSSTAAHRGRSKDYCAVL